MAKNPDETRGRPPKPKPDLDPADAGMQLELRERIKAEADPVGFLIRVMRGETFVTEVVNEDGTTGTHVEYPCLATRTEIALKLTGKILPDLKSLELAAPASGGASPGNGEAYERIASRLGRAAPVEREGSTTH
jgi:hypothetical protein